MGVYEEMMKQYQQSISGGTNKSEKKYDLKNYFNTSLPKGVKTLKKRFRILPPSEDEKTSFQSMFGHEKKVDGKWSTYACLKHEKDDDCPFCESRELLLSSGNDDEKELAKDFSARRFYVIKVIDRDNEADGVKFWRFKHNYKKEGIFDKIMSAIEDCGHDVTDAVTGRDLILTIKEGTNGKATTIGYALESTPLTNDEHTMEEWLGHNNTKTWKDVYSIKTYEYLALIVQGYVPMWDKAQEKWVAKESDTNTTETHTENFALPEINEEPKDLTKTTTAKAKAKVKVVEIEDEEEEETYSSDEDEDDDLPF
jgi:hypothetical protein